MKQVAGVVRPDADAAAGDDRGLVVHGNRVVCMPAGQVRAVSARKALLETHGPAVVGADIERYIVGGGDEVGTGCGARVAGARPERLGAGHAPAVIDDPDRARRALAVDAQLDVFEIDVLGPNGIVGQSVVVDRSVAPAQRIFAAQGSVRGLARAERRVVAAAGRSRRGLQVQAREALEAAVEIELHGEDPVDDADLVDESRLRTLVLAPVEAEDLEAEIVDSVRRLAGLGQFAMNSVELQG